MVDEENMLGELIEINLLFAKLELGLVSADPSALWRALYHIEEAMKDIRAHKRRSSAKPKHQGILAAEQLNGLAQPA